VTWLTEAKHQWLFRSCLCNLLVVLTVVLLVVPYFLGTAFLDWVFWTIGII